MKAADATQPDRFWDGRSAALAVLLIQIAALRLAVTNWTPSLSVTQTLGFLGVALGLALGYSSLSPRAARRFCLAYGLLLIPAQLLVAVKRADLLYVDLDRILFRLFDSVVLLFRSQPVDDALFFIAVSSIGFWGIGVYAGYQLTRRQNFLGIVLPAGVVMLIIQVYDAWAAARVWSLAAYIFFALLLLGRLYFLKSKNMWKTKRVFFTSDVESDLSRVALISAAVVVFAAWIFPNVLSGVAPAAKAWTEFTQPIRDRLSDAVSALDSPYRAPINGDFYGANLFLGSSAPISDTPVFYVKVDSIESIPARYYWRGRIYDQYLNGQWTDSQSTRKNFNPKTDQHLPSESAKRYEATATVTVNFSKQELMYAPAEIIWTDRPAQMISNPINASAFDVTAWLASPNLVAGESYQLRALIANPSVAELRGAGEEYPQWVKDRYLQIPAEIEPRLKKLAERVTASKKTPYDKAQAIAEFLRNEIEYTTKLTDSPASGQDPLMWVLFEYKKGFCMYSASAEVLMLRSLGIPARMAVGFSEGKFDSLRSRYTVARLNSHAWPEVYFPNIGWVEFEPTGNQPSLERPRESINPVVEEDNANPRERMGAKNGASEPPASNATLPENKNALTLEIVARFLYPLFLLELFALGIFWTRHYSLIERLPVYLESRYIESGRQPPTWLKRWSQWATLMPIQRAFHVVDLCLRWLGASQPARATPLERANALTELLPSARAEIGALREEHEAALFTNRLGNLERARRAARKILLATVRNVIARALARSSL